jgi:O-antigen/teichoic acid export membrane protein
LVFGKGYVKGENVLRILSIYGFLRSLFGPIGPLFLSVGQQKVLTLSNIINFLLILITMYPLSRIWGIEGAAFSILLSYIVSQQLLIPTIFKIFKNE